MAFFCLLTVLVLFTQVYELLGASDEPILVVPPPPPSASSVSITQAESQTNPSALSPSGTAATPPDTLLPPSFLTAIADNAAVILSWDPSTGPKAVSGYLVFRSTEAGHYPSKAINKKPLAETSFIDNRENSTSPPDNRHTYYYRIRGYDTDSMLSDYSQEVSATPSGPLLPPSHIKIQAGDSVVKLVWSEPVSSGYYDLSGYQIFKSTASGQYDEANGVSLPASTREFTDFQVVNKQAYFYQLRSVDTQGQTSAFSQELAAIPYKGVAPPNDLSAIGIGDQVIKLSWKASKGGGSFPVAGYNVYRSVSSPVDVSLPPINKVLITDTSYEDSPEYSVSAPVKGITYHYAAVAVDEKSNPSKPSTESSAAPIESLSSIDSLGNIALPGESSLSISGRKSINMGYQWVAYTNNNNINNVNTASSGSNRGFILDQQLQVRLQGKVGRKITVDVDYDDKTDDKRKISIVYQGDRDEIVEDASFGDIRMDLPRTEFAGYDKNLFGIKLRMHSPNNRLRFTAIGAQTKGITETKRFIGNVVPDINNNVRGRDILDNQFIAYRYYYLTRDSKLVTPIAPGSSTMQESIVPGSVFVYMDRQSAADRLRPDAFFSTPNRTYAFIYQNPGVDYSVDYSTGIITFYAQVTSAYTIAVAFAVKDNQTGQIAASYGFSSFNSTNPQSSQVSFDETKLLTNNNSGVTDDNHHLIQDGVHNPNILDGHMVVQFYDLGNRKIYDPKVDPDFLIAVYQGSQPVFIPRPSDPNSANYYVIDSELGILKFASPYPFMFFSDGSAPKPLTAPFTQPFTPFNPAETDAYRIPPISNYRIHIEYKYRVASYTLHFSIIRGSETITVDGRHLLRDSDYFLDYDTGILVFSNPDLVRPDSVVEATYEYSPFGGQFTSNLFGARAEYDITDRLSLGSTYIYNANQAPLQAPQVGASPFSLNLLDADAKAWLPNNLVSKALSSLPFIKKVNFPVDVTISAEVAHSWFNPNTFSQNGENGVGMVDDFESIANVTSASTDYNNWFPASRPLDAPQNFVNGVETNRRFSWISTQQRNGHDLLSINAAGGSPLKSQLQVVYSHFDSTNNWDAFVYPLSRAGQNLHDYSSIQVWVQTDNPAVFYLDLGVVNEDANGNGVLDTESSTGTLGPGQDIGIGNGIYLPPSSNLYQNINYWGSGNGRLDTEDLNGTGQLQIADSYYEFSGNIAPVVNGTTNNYQLLTFNLTDGVARSSNGAPLPSTNPSDPSFFNNIKHLRFWFKTQSGAAPNGNIWIESIQAQGNRWQARTDLQALDVLGNTVSVVVDPSKFFVQPISQQIKGNYVPNTNFYNTQQQGANSAREQSLEVDYNLNSNDRTPAGNPIYNARKLLTNGGLGIDFSPYKTLRLDIYKPAPTARGEVLLLRMGSDDFNYLQYTINLDSIPNFSWQTVNLALDGSDGNRKVVGNAYLRYVNQVSISILNPNPTSSPESLWLDNLRVADSTTREGNALKVRTQYSMLGGGVNINHTYQEMDSDFIQVDQQGFPPKQHTKLNSVDVTSNLIKSVPISASWSHAEGYTEPDKVFDPGYSNNFNSANNAHDRLQFNTGLSGIKNLNLNVTGFLQSDRNEFLPTYINQQYLLYPNAGYFSPDNDRISWEINPTASYSLPSFGLPFWKTLQLGGDRFQANFKYDENVIQFDSATDTSTPYYNQSQGTETLSGRWDANYKFFSWLAAAPGLAYSLVRSRWNLPQPSQPVPYYTLGPGNYLREYQKQTEAINPTLTLDFGQVPGLVSPRLIYNIQNTWNYIANTLVNTGSLEWQSGLKPGDWFGNPKIPQFQFSHKITVNSQFNNNIADTAPADYFNQMSTDKASQHQSFWQSIWWIRWDKPTLDENYNEDLNNPYNIENLAINASKRADSSLSTRFDLNLGGVNLTLSPRLGYSTDREMQQRFNATTNYQTSAGTAVDIQQPNFIPFSKILKPTNLHAQIDYSSTNRTNNNGDIINTTNGLNYSLTVPNKPLDNFTLTFDFSGSNSSNINITNLGYGTTSVETDQTSYRTALRSTYFLSVLHPIRLNFWPFNGRELKLTQKLQLDNNVSAEFHRDFGSGLLTPTNTDLYELTNGVTYNVLTNVQANLSLKQDYFINRTVFGQDYYAITLQLNVAATF